MSVIEARLGENYPAIFMTMVSLIVALVYENLVSAFGDFRDLGSPTPENIFVWAQFFVLTFAPLEFWFTQSVHAACVRPVFTPRHALVPIIAAVALNFFVSTIGAGHAVAWMYVSPILIMTAWVAFRDFGRLYAEDDEIPGGVDSHRASGLIHLVAGAAMLPFAGLLHAGRIGLGTAALVIVTGGLATIVGHVVWYREWRRAAGLSEG